MNAGRVFCPHCGKPLAPGDNFCEGCGAKVDNSIPPIAGNVAASNGEHVAQGTAANVQVLERIAGYERISAILWICLGGIQLLVGTIGGFKVTMIIVGVWNIHAAYSRLKLPDRIRARSPGIPAMYEKQIVQLIVIGVLNLALGGVIGVAFVIFDFVIRGMVLRHRALFADESPSMQGV